MILNLGKTMDRYALSREFEFIRACDEAQRCTDIGELKGLCIELLRVNRNMREMLAALAKAEIPPAP